jgi:RNA polymerase sigma-70 factor (ECF subfamily)
MKQSARHSIERLFAEQYAALVGFFYRRTRSKADAPDLAQEVYLRMLRVKDLDSIQSPQSYLFTVASNLLKEDAVLQRKRGSRVDIAEAADDWQLQNLPNFVGELDTANRVERLRIVLQQLSPKCRAAVVLQYRDGLSYQEIADRLHVSTNMVKKYLSQALVHCRGRMSRLA